MNHNWKQLLLLWPCTDGRFKPFSVFQEMVLEVCYLKKERAPWLESANELYWPSDRRLSAKLVTNFVDGGCQVVRVTHTYSRILNFLDRKRYFFFQVAPQLYYRGWVDPVPDSPYFLQNLGAAGNRTRTWIGSQELWPLDLSKYN
jgi:hypothetical protein